MVNIYILPGFTYPPHPASEFRPHTVGGGVPCSIGRNNKKSSYLYHSDFTILLFCSDRVFGCDRNDIFSTSACLSSRPPGDNYCELGFSSPFNNDGQIVVTDHVCDGADTLGRVNRHFILVTVGLGSVLFRGSLHAYILKALY